MGRRCCGLPGRPLWRRGWVRGGTGLARTRRGRCWGPGQREERVLVARAEGEAQGWAGEEGVFGEASEVVGGELLRGVAEALGVGAEAEVVRGGDDGGAAAVGIDVDVEGGVGDPVDEPPARPLVAPLS